MILETNRDLEYGNAFVSPECYVSIGDGTLLTPDVLLLPI